MPEHTERQQELLFEIGRRLKAAREEQGLTVQDVASRTRIHSAYLEKIESGSTEGLPALAFVRGFMRNYMQTLGIDDPALAEAVAELGHVPQAVPPPQPLRPDTTEKLLGMESETANWTRWILVAALAVLLIWVVYLLVRVTTTGDPVPATTSTAVTPPPSPAPEALPGSGSVPGAARPSSAGTAGQPTGAAEPRANLRLTVRGLEETWLRLSLDRQPAVELLIHPAESVNFDANEEIRLTVGKSQGVSVYLNGLEVALPAEKNRLVPEMVLNKFSLIKMQN